MKRKPENSEFYGMFTGIIEAKAVITAVKTSGTNRSFLLSSPLGRELKVDQSLAHNGVCLTVESIQNDEYQVTAIQETLQKTTLGQWKAGDTVNLERSLQWNGRLDGHMVQGHVDATGTCINRRELQGSWEFTIRFPEAFAALVIEKGSISLDGISLTVFNVTRDTFTVAIIPYTYEHTSMGSLTEGKAVNLEFDLLGKYVQRHFALSGSVPGNS